MITSLYKFYIFIYLPVSYFWCVRSQHGKKVPGSPDWMITDNLSIQSEYQTYFLCTDKCTFNVYRKLSSVPKLLQVLIVSFDNTL